MLIKAYLIIGDLKLVVKTYSLSVQKGVSYNNFPNGKGELQAVSLEVEAPRNNMLWEEAIKNYSMTPLMQIRFEPAIQGSEKTRIIAMYDCHVVYHSTNYHHQSNEPLTESLEITCGGLEDSWYPSTVISKHWRETFPQSNSNTTIVNEELESKITKFSITDENGKEKSKYSIGEYIYLNIKSVNKIGNNITIKLKEKTKDFEYKGKVLPNDTLSNYIIQSDEDIIKLKVIDPIN